jgi:DNA-binding beta-propeller fold protein YncE
VQKFNNSGTFLTKWGSAGSANGQFSTPYGIALDGSNTVYVLDAGNLRVQTFDSNGNYLGQWGGLIGNAPGQFVSPHGIAIDSSNNVYVADSGNNRIQKFSNHGSFLTSWGSTNGYAAGQFSSPMAITADNNNQFYVADTYNNRIQVFTYNPIPVTPPPLTITSSGTNVILTWSATGFTLQSATNLVSPDWITVSGQNTVTNPIAGTQMFYRLSQ